VDGCGGCRLTTELTAGRTQRALELAYRYLDRRERTVSEVRRHLVSRDVDAATAASVTEALVDQGALDDTRFARLFVQDKRDLEQWGTERVRRGLVARGIDPELAVAAVGSEPGGETGASELMRALGVLRQKFPQPPRGRRERERALGLLLRKGYEPELALDALHAHAQGLPA
jgi:regulatory protein